MWYPDRAVIKTPTLSEAKRLNMFLAELGFKYTNQYEDAWQSTGEATCFDYQPVNPPHMPAVLHADSDWYYSAREDEVDEIELVLDEFFMITVDEFIGVCVGAEEDAELTLELDDLL